MTDPDGVIADVQLPACRVRADRGRKASVRRIETGQIGDAVQIGRLVDGYRAVLRTKRGFVQRTQEAAADAAVTVDGDAHH